VASQGSFRFQGVPVEPLSRDERALLRRHYIGFVFQGLNLLKRTTAIENVEMALLYRGVPRAQRRARACEALRLVGLADRETHTSAQLSGGQQQRVAIARAMVTEPLLLLADEPTGNLDSARAHEILELIARLNRDAGVTVVLVTHEADIAAYAQRELRFQDGRLAGDVRAAAVPT
jgi:putative ABC transport system ATP-binding protein